VFAALLALDTFLVADSSAILFRMGLWRASDYEQRLMKYSSSLHFERLGDELGEPVRVEDRDAPGVTASVTPIPSATGWWAPTVDHYDSRLLVSIYRGAMLTDEERSRVRALFADRYEKNRDFDGARIAEFLRGPEDPNIVVYRPTGYAHNLMTVLCVAAFIWSLGWVPRLVTNRRRARLSAEGLCPFCRYDMQGLTTATCPECGKQTR